jgi:hypothetical protein
MFNTPYTLTFSTPTGLASMNAAYGSTVSSLATLSSGDAGPSHAAIGTLTSAQDVAANAGVTKTETGQPGDPTNSAEAPRSVCLPVSVEDFVAQIETKALAPRFVCDPMLGEAHRMVAFANGLRSGSGLFGQKLVARALKTIPHLVILENEVIPISREAIEKANDSGRRSGQLVPRAGTNLDGRLDQRSRLSVDIVVYNPKTKNIHLIEVRRKSETLGFANENRNFSGRFVAAASCARAHGESVHGWEVKDVYYKVLDLKCRGGRSTMLMALHELNDFLGIDGADQVINAGLTRIEAAVHGRFTAFVRGFVAAAVPAPGQVTDHASDPATDHVTGGPDARGYNPFMVHPWVRPLVSRESAPTVACLVWFGTVRLRQNQSQNRPSTLMPAPSPKARGGTCDARPFER